MKYERLTSRNEEPFYAFDACRDCEHKIGLEKKCACKVGAYIRLYEWENKIERGELISTKQEERSDQELAFFAEHNDGVRKLFADDLKDRLQADLAHGDITQEAYEVVVGEINYCLGEVEE